MDQEREYQTQSIAGIRNEFANGSKKVLLWLATGAGKTFVFCKMVKAAVEKGNRVIIVVRGRKLVDQASQRLSREMVAHGVLMAGHWNYRPHMPVQVCSIDTLISRDLKPEANLIIIDEAHLSNSPGYKSFLSKYDAFIVAVTATPWVEKGLRHVADKIVHPITMQQLTDEGYLVPFRIFAPAAPDLSQVQVSSSTKDYVNSQLEDAMVAGQLTGKIIDHWKKLALDRPTICFAVNIHHSRLLVERFAKSGISAEHCDADSSDKERNEIIKRLESGETKVVCNVGIFCTGVDIPSLGAIIMARPTKSRNLFIQQAGRGTRPYDGKSDCLLLDHAGNVTTHGFPTDEPEVNLDGEKSRDAGVSKSKICKSCFAVYRGPKCHECGIEAPEAPKVEIAETNDELKELTFVERDPYLIVLKSIQNEGRHRKRHYAWAYHKFFEKFGLEISRNYLPMWFIQKKIEQDSPFRRVHISGD